VAFRAVLRKELLDVVRIYGGVEVVIVAVYAIGCQRAKIIV
jgi:hypothetical protein